MHDKVPSAPAGAAGGGWGDTLRRRGVWIPAVGVVGVAALAIGLMLTRAAGTDDASAAGALDSPSPSLTPSATASPHASPSASPSPSPSSTTSPSPSANPTSEPDWVARGFVLPGDLPETRVVRALRSSDAVHISFEGVSADGRTIAYLESEQRPPTRVVLADVDSGEPLLDLETQSLGLIEWDPTRSFVAFDVADAKGTDVRVADASGAVTTAIRLDGVWVHQLAWSPDGRLAVSVADAAASAESSRHDEGRPRATADSVLVIDLASARVIRDLGAGTSASVTPDGSLVYFRALHGDTFDLMAAPVSGGAAFAVGGGDGMPVSALRLRRPVVWAPDGSVGAYVEGDIAQELRVIKPDGTFVTSVVPRIQELDSLLEFSPDSRWVSSDDITSSVAVAIDVRTGEEIEWDTQAYARFTNSGSTFGAMTWKPDSSGLVASTVDRRSGDSPRMLELSLRDFILETLNPPQWARGEFSWSADGARLLWAVRADDDGPAAIMMIDGNT